MSEKRNRGIHDFSQYDAMATEELEEILRLDSTASEDEGSDTELLLYVMGVLAQRKRNSDDPGKTAHEAWESFQQNYLPDPEECLADAPEPEKTVKRSRPWLRRAIAVAAVVALLVCIPLTASAFGWEDIWNAVAKWAKETFSFVSGDDTQLTEPSVDDAREYASLREALAQAGEEFDSLPTWMPEGYILEDITIDENPVQKNYLAIYVNGGKYLKICVRSYLDSDSEKVEIKDELLEVYEVSGTEYYICTNTKHLRVAWLEGSYECYISGELTIDEIKKMIDSIGKG